jgi:hypothetical protein
MNKIINNLSSGDSNLMNSFNQSPSTLAQSIENEGLKPGSQNDEVNFNNSSQPPAKAKKNNSFYTNSQIGSRLNVVA